MGCFTGTPYSRSTSSEAGESEGLDALSAVVETARGLITSLGQLNSYLQSESRQQSLPAALLAGGDNLTSEALTSEAGMEPDASPGARFAPLRPQLTQSPAHQRGCREAGGPSFTPRPLLREAPRPTCPEMGLPREREENAGKLAEPGNPGT